MSWNIKFEKKTRTMIRDQSPKL